MIDNHWVMKYSSDSCVLCCNDRERKLQTCHMVNSDEFADVRISNKAFKLLNIQRLLIMFLYFI